MRMGGRMQRLGDELDQAWAVALTDVKVYYLKPGMIMFGFLMPFFMFFSFSVKRDTPAEDGLARLLALAVFFTAAAAGPIIIPLDRRAGTYDRLLAAPMSLVTLLLGKASVGMFFALLVAFVSVLFGLMAFGAVPRQPGLLVLGIALGAFAFSALGLVFGSIPTRNPGDAQMPATLLRWALLFVSGVFIPLEEMAAVPRAVALLSPLTYAQDLMNHALPGSGYFSPWADAAALLLASLAFLMGALVLHRRNRQSA